MLEKNPMKNPEIVKKMLKTMKEKYPNRGELIKGYKHSKKTKKKLRKLNSGANNPNWIDGRSFKPYSHEFTKKLKEFVRMKFNRRCQICNTPENGTRLDVHHIDFDKENCNLNNLLPLCRSCHMKIHYPEKSFK